MLYWVCQMLCFVGLSWTCPWAVSCKAVHFRYWFMLAFQGVDLKGVEWKEDADFQSQRMCQLDPETNWDQRKCRNLGLVLGTQAQQVFGPWLDQLVVEPRGCFFAATCTAWEISEVLVRCFIGKLESSSQLGVTWCSQKRDSGRAGCVTRYTKWISNQMCKLNLLSTTISPSTSANWISGCFSF